jgi:tetratricopeptide (TPR) repeat protein
MSFAVIVALGTSLALSQAQTGVTTPELLEQSVAAYREGDAEQATRLAEQGVANASGPGERFDALILYGDLRKELGDLYAAYELFSRAVELVESEAPDNVSALSLALTRQSAAALDMGRREEWLALGERIEALNRVAEEPIWRFENDMRVRHRFSGMPCPANAEGFVRVELTTYNARGTDVACRYAIPDGPRLVMTLHAFLTHATQDTAFDTARNNMLRNMSAAHRIEENTRDIAGVPVRYAIYRQGGTTGGVWTHQTGAWTVKLRLTHYGGLEREDLASAARLAFSGVGLMEDHLADCSALDGAGTFDPLNTAEAIGAAVLPEVAGSDADDIDALECFLGDADFAPSGGTYQARVDDEGHLLDYRAYPRGNQDVYLQAVNDDSAFARMLENAGEGSQDVVLPERWLMRQVSPSGSGVYGMFSGAPSPAAFGQTVDGVLNGSIPLAAWMSEDEDGQLHIELIGPGSDETENPSDR